MAVTPRKSAAQRREEILAVALEHFAVGGYHGTSTEAIAREAGISQPYLFRLFRTKKELFLACSERSHQKIRVAFARAAEQAPPGERLKAMGHAYVAELLPDRHAIMMQMQGHVAAASDPEIREQVQTRFVELGEEVGRLAGVPQDKVWDFLSTGMMLNVLTALDLPVPFE